MVRESIIETKFKNLPDKYKQELLQLKKERNKKTYLAKWTYVLVLFCFLILLVLSSGFSVYMLQKTPGPSAPIEGGIIANFFREYMLTTLAAMSSPILCVILFLDLVFAIGKTDYFVASFALIKRLGSRLTLYNYSEIRNMRLVRRKIRRNNRYDYGGIDLIITLNNGAITSFSFFKRDDAMAFLTSIRERIENAHEDLSIIPRKSFLPLPIVFFGYLLFSILVPACIINCVLIPFHNNELIEITKNNIFLTRDGKTVLTDKTRKLKNYLDFLPNGEHRTKVLQKYKAVRKSELEKLAWDLVRFEGNEVLQNDYLYKYRRAIFLYNEYFKENFLQDEYNLLIKNKYDEWLELRRSKNVADQQAARNDILDYREKAMEQSGYGPFLKSKMSFYRIYFVDDEFAEEEELLAPLGGYEQWKAFREGKLNAEEPIK
jgi:hypothetical protein